MDFIEKLANLLSDRQEFRIDAKKVNEDLVLMVIPDRKGTGKVTHITVPKEDNVTGIDDKIFDAIKTQQSNESVKFQSETTEGSENEDEEDDEDQDEKKDNKNAPAKKAGKSKAKPASKRLDKKKDVAKKEEAKDVAVEEPKSEEPAVTNEESKAPTTKEQFKELMKQGDDLFADRKYTEARDAFKQAIELKPDDEKAIQKHANAEKWIAAIERIKSPKSE